MGALKKVGIVAVGLLVIGLVTRGSNAPSTAATRVVVDPHQQFVDSVRVTKSGWDVGGFGNVFIANPTIQNHNTFTVNDIAIECTTFAKTGTKLSVVRGTVYDFIPKGATKTFKGINLGLVNPQSESASCRVTDIAK